MSTCDVFNCLFPLDVQNEIQLLFMASLFIGFLVESKSEIRFRTASFSFSPCLMGKKVAKSEVIPALLDSFPELHLEW